MARDSHMRERLFFAHSDPHSAAILGDPDGMPDDDQLVLAVVARFKAFKKRVSSRTFAGK
jgi:hypothetical protein